MQSVNLVPVSSALSTAATASPRLLPSQERCCSSSGSNASFSGFDFFKRTSKIRNWGNGSSSSSRDVEQQQQQQRLKFGRRRGGSRRNNSPRGFTLGRKEFSKTLRPPRCTSSPPAATAAGMAVTVREDVAAPSWEALQGTLGSGGETERLADARERIFSPGEQPQLVFYRDTWATCPYCERVWLYLEEKQISYRVEKIDMSWYGEKPAWYKEMVPNGGVPAVKLEGGDGRAMAESLGIMFRLEERFSEKRPLLPSRDTEEFRAVDGLLELEKELVGSWVPRLRQPVGDGGAFEAAVEKVNSALSNFGGPFFLGKEFSLVDAAFAPFLERIAASMPYWHGIQIRGEQRWPALNAWYDAVDSRPSYRGMKADDLSVVRNLESQLDSVPSDAGFFYRALVDGTHGSWELPLKPETTAWGTDDLSARVEARQEAARYLIGNHETIVENVLRTVVEDGDRHFRAVDGGLRYVAQALLAGFENVKLPENLEEEVGLSLSFLKDRILVPRDLSYPAARQLRAHLQWLVKRTGARSPVASAEVGLEQDSGWNAWLYPNKDELPDDKEMSIFDHLEELRQRLAISGAAVTVAILGCFIFSRDLIRILEAPVYTQGVRFLQLSPGEFFFTTLKVSGYCGLLIGSPVILYEIIAFVIPGLTRSERRFLGPIVLGSSVLFYLGVVFSYIVLTPAALNFFVNYAEGAVESLWSIDQYFEFVLVLLFSTGLSFQVPVIQLLLGQTRLVTGDQMLSLWRYVVVGSVVAAAVLTPSTDPLTQLLLAGPLMGLYFGGAYLVKYLVKDPSTTA